MFFYNELGRFVERNRLYSVIIGTIFSQFLTELFHSTINDLIMPMMNIDVNKNKKNDIIELKKFKIKIFNIQFKFGSFLVALIRFIIIMCVLLMLNRIRRNSKRKK
jgi:large-conductance mechanosensitive channel